jgi:Zn-dependent protease
VQTMKCQKCGQETFLPFQCPYCGDQFCSAHRLPESHDCPRMDLARARRSEEGVFVQEPNSYEYRVTFGQPRRANRRVYFSPKELKHLAIAALLVIGIGLSIVLFDSYFVQIGWAALAFFAGILTASFLAHELAHKVAAQRRGLWAEFRLTLWGAAITLVSVISPLFKIIAPGAVMVSGSARMDEIAKISIAGPLTNIAFSAVLLGAGLFSGPYALIFFYVALWNGFIAVFNLIPMGILDGFKIFSWNKAVWALAFVSSVVLTAIAYFFATM